MNQLGFSFDVNRCSGCMACVVACLDQNDLPGAAHAYRNVTRLERGEYPATQMSFLSLSCLHCGDAPCIMACPTGALFKRDKDGIVLVNQDLCIGCHSCSLACPFGAPQFPDGEKMQKCDLCIERLEHHMEPACVRACPTFALDFGRLEDLAREKAAKASLSLLESFHTRSQPIN